MRKNSVVFVLFLLNFMLVLGQSARTEKQSSFVNMPKESIYVHLNESLLFTGENFRYKLYCIDKKTKETSKLSQIAYLRLVGKDGNVVFTHKVRLKDGSGYGDFFVPTSVPTGSYKLLGYSEWMKNFDTTDFFQSDILIINPYQVTSEFYLEPQPDSTDVVGKASFSSTEERGVTSKNIKSPFLQLQMEKSELGKREQAIAHISALNDVVKNGDYSISVRKVDSLPSPTKVTAHNFFDNYVLRGQNIGGSGLKAEFLPQLRGEVISGTITNKESGQPVQGKRISLSLPGNEFLLKVATSDAEGRFEFIVNREYDNTNASLQILADNWEEYEVTMDSNDLNDLDMSFTDFKLSKQMKDYILQRSIENQIENAFKEQRKDSTLPAKHLPPNYRKYTASYDLDDYTRFNSIGETIIEVVDQVSIRKLANGERVFEIRPEEGFTDLSMLPMVFVDGLFIKRHEDFMDFSAKKIKSIDFSRDKIMLGAQPFQGVLLFKTIDGDFYNEFYAPHLQNVALFRPQPRKDYFDENYKDVETQIRIPDFRHQLLWEPNLDLSKEKNEIKFYTSDVPGEYELVVEGFTSNGNPVSVKQKFIVK
ncbi:carboxypeptidase-like regulatory domain-containing protein [Flagellimonas onchidii]|uniref:carboxypeptidase-like regulatory domain-containing protein n=1 Tax=Flagellimonas onchidii TaxID=2562684 RepID=UPI0010A667E4|nr:carboxypeptidase-like regulatory domain-containing protein [Allomuricauda onchidii]